MSFTQGQAGSAGCHVLPAFPALPAGPAAFSDLRKLPLEAWGSQQIKLMGKKFVKTKPCVINLKVCSKQMIKVAEVSYLGLKRSTLAAFKA